MPPTSCRQNSYRFSTGRCCWNMANLWAGPSEDRNSAALLKILWRKMGLKPYLVYGETLQIVSISSFQGRFWEEPEMFRVALIDATSKQWDTTACSRFPAETARTTIFALCCLSEEHKEENFSVECNFPAWCNSLVQRQGCFEWPGFAFIPLTGIIGDAQNPPGLAPPWCEKLQDYCKGWSCWWRFFNLLFMYLKYF